MANSRTKGAAFERQIAAALFERTGITFKRDLDQYRERDRGDLLPDDAAWPFLLECKAYASGGFQAAWWTQADKAALATGKMPAVIWKINNKPIRVRIKLRSAMECISRKRWSAEDPHLIDVDLDGLCYLAREGMAE